MTADFVPDRIESLERTNGSEDNITYAADQTTMQYVLED
jgi:hypothetical protein